MAGAVLYVAGFTTVFILLGIGAAGIGHSVRQVERGVEIAGGILLVFFGLVVVGALRLPILERVRGLSLPERLRGRGVAAAYLVGIVFGIGWTPCVGPYLGVAFVLAASSAHVALRRRPAARLLDRAGAALRAHRPALGVAADPAPPRRPPRRADDPHRRRADHRARPAAAQRLVHAPHVLPRADQHPQLSAGLSPSPMGAMLAPVAWASTDGPGTGAGSAAEGADREGGHVTERETQ